MAKAVYILCALTSLVCAFMLWRGYRRSGTRLLLWSCLCFVGLTINNMILFVDLVLLPDVNLSMIRVLPALVGLLLLLYGLIWDSR